MSTGVMTRGPWPRQVHRVMAIAIADLGVESFGFGETLYEDGGDFGRGCFARECASGSTIKRITDGGLGTRWCVGVEYTDKVMFTTSGLYDTWKQIDAFTDRVLSIPGWRSYPTLPSCKCGATSHWIRLHGPNGGYGGGIQTYFIWDEGTERADLENREGPSGSDGERRRAIAQLEMRIGMANLHRLSEVSGGKALIDRWCANGRSQTRDAIAKEALELLGQRQWRETV